MLANTDCASWRSDYENQSLPTLRKTRANPAVCRCDLTVVEIEQTRTVCGNVPAQETRDLEKGQSNQFLTEWICERSLLFDHIPSPSRSALDPGTASGDVFASMVRTVF